MLGWVFRRKPKEVLPPPEWLIVGLGNPGPEYKGTRHNIGFDVVDRLAASSKIRLETRKHRAVYGQGLLDGKSIVLVKPMTYMNFSGQAVTAISRHFSISPEKILVVADDLDLPIGKLRLRAEGSAGGHNGHKSIIQALGTQGYPRLKFGIGKSGETVDHVLSPFDPDERLLVQEAIERACQAIGLVLASSIDDAMAKFNGLTKD